MRLTTRGRYAVTAMLDLALNGSSKPISLADISRRQEISLSYLEQLFSRLRRNELVTSVRGPGGGYLLNRPRSAAPSMSRRSSTRSTRAWMPQSAAARAIAREEKCA